MIGSLRSKVGEPTLLNNLLSLSLGLQVVPAISIYQSCLESGPEDVRRGGSECPQSSEPTALPCLLVAETSDQCKLMLTMITREPSQNSKVESGYH